MKKELSLLVLIVIWVIIRLNGEVYAISASPEPIELTQADGTTFKARKWGDELLHGWETVDGYTIIFDGVLGSWVYAVNGSDGSLISSSNVVGSDYPPALAKHKRPFKDTLLNKTSMKYSRQPVLKFPKRAIASTGTANIPVILINFNNTTTTYTSSDFNNLLFGTGNYSMKDYYSEVSYGKFTVSAGPGGVIEWYTAARDHDYYGENDTQGLDMFPGTLVREAVIVADNNGFNFAPYDNDGDCYVDMVMIVHQGSGEESVSGLPADIWSHTWNLNDAYYYWSSNGGEYTTDDACPQGGYIKVNVYTVQPEKLGSNIMTVGVFAHEFGHVLGLPDLYDTDSSSEGIGRWSLMAGGGWNYTTVYGDRPAHPDAWSKYYLGWVTPAEVSGTLINKYITQAVTAADVYRLGNGTPASGEYFLIENRQKTGFDAGLPGAGLLIWHIDGGWISSALNLNTVNDSECYPDGPSCNAYHYGVALVQADNSYDMEKGNNDGDEGDPYPGTGNNTLFRDTSLPDSNFYNGTPSNVSITNISASSNTMTATLTFGSSDLTPPSGSVSISNDATSTNSTSVTLSISAIDNIGVTGYYASETSTVPSASATGWISVTSATNYSATVSFTLSSGLVGDNTKTVYVWFRDTAGNISSSASDSIILTVLDTTAPSSVSISINNGDTSTTSTSVTLNLSAMDSVGVTGYCAKESSASPSATDSCWTSVTSATNYSATVSFTLSSGDGTKTVYVWFKDSAGNINTTLYSDSIILDTIKSVSSSGGGGCFIAAAAYGSYMADEVKILREFRDKYLLTNSIGRKFVTGFYYRYSPPVAKYIAKYELLKAITRIILTPMVYSIKYPFILAGILLIGGLALVRRQYYYKKPFFGYKENSR